MECTYCGIDRADTMDHVIPISATHLRRKGNWYNGGEIVPCCRECNSILGNKRLHTIAARADYLAKRLGKKYSKLLKATKWTNAELAELGITLRESILAQMHQAMLVGVRIAHCEHVAKVYAANTAK